jgi:hypothetical protein
MSSKKTVLSAVFAAGISLCSASVLAAVSAEEAKQLGGALTEFGAEKAGNKDGSIPAYTGGQGMVAGYDVKTAQGYIDPYKSEKPLYTIDAKNAAQYDAVLGAGTKALIKQYPGYRIDVYPTHRSIRYTQDVLKATAKNATQAKLGGPVEGDNLESYEKGVPFPVPKSGVEVMWNHYTRFAPAVTHRKDQGWVVDASGALSDLPTVDEWFVHPWFDKSGQTEKDVPKGTIFGFNAQLTAPPSSAGIVFLNFYTDKGEDGGQKVWFYTPGQRRVRMAPEFAYDVPIASYGGIILWDEIFGAVGRLDRFDYKLVGKKEIIVPYNCYLLTNIATQDQYFTKKFVNPDLTRWEKHRVWVIEATRKAGARHIYSRRTFYVDEDSWAIAQSEHYDNAGNIYRVTQNLITPTYDTGGVDVDSWTTYDLIKGNYMLINVGVQKQGYFVKHYDSSAGFDHMNLTPQSVAASGVR